MEYDIVIINGTIIDGTGAPRRKANVGIKDGLIAIISDEPLTGNKEIDASSRIVCPGFIDIHSHSEWITPLDNHPDIFTPLVLQGTTTFVGGNCGFSPFPVTEEAKPWISRNSEFLVGGEPQYHWTSTGEYLGYIEKNGVFLNVATLVGHNSIRALVLANDPREPSDTELKIMAGLTREALLEGAFGFSIGLAYTPGVFAEKRELKKLLQVVAEEKGIWTFHGHTYSWTSPFFRPKFFGKPHNLRDLEELLTLTEETGVRTNVSHVIFKGKHTWKTYPRIIALIERAVERGLDVAFDAIPYHWGNSLVNTLLPGWFLRDFDKNFEDPKAVAKLTKEVRRTERIVGRSFKDISLLWADSEKLEPYFGMSFHDIGEKRNISEVDACLWVAKESRGTAKILTASYSGEEGGYEEPLFAVVSHPLCSFELDTAITTAEGPQNPASYGGFPRVLGRFCRELQLFSLEDAIRRMTSFSAERIGLQHIGRIASGYFADIVVFDEKTVNDNTSLANPSVPPSGIEHVLISGVPVVERGVCVSKERHGRVLRKKNEV